jgi:hypothetical protein
MFKDLDQGHSQSKDNDNDDGEVTRLYDFNSPDNSNDHNL